MPECSDSFLGDGKDTRILLVSKGAKNVIAELNPIDGSYGRALDATSHLSITGNVAGALGISCCDGWENIYTWATEIMVYREGRGNAWCGPVTDVAFEYGKVQVEADDITAWWSRRTVSDHFFDSRDLTDIFVALHEEAMKPDPAPDFPLHATPSGKVGDRRYSVSDRMYVSDAMTELAETGVDYTAYGRMVLVGGEEIQATPYVTLLDEHWTTPPQVRQRGNDQATVVTVKYQGGSVTVKAAENILAFYGYIERVFDEPDIIDESTATLAAETRLHLLQSAVFIETPDGAALENTAPITFDKLIPGMRVRVETSSGCRQVHDDFRLSKVEAQLSGEVSISLQPLGHTIKGDSGEIFG